MQRPLQITFHETEVDEQARQLIEEKMAKLETLYGALLGARVVVEAPHQRHREGNCYVVRIDLSVPGQELVVTREHGDHPANENLFIAIREAFAAAERRLKSFVDMRRTAARQPHERPPVGQVVRLFPYEGYGFLLSADGREVYFERGAVRHAQFDRLRVGQAVHYAEATGQEGARASIVELRHEAP